MQSRKASKACLSASERAWKAGGGRRPLSSVSRDRFDDARRAPVVQEVRAVGDAPERHGTELAARRLSLREAVGERRPHVVEQEVRVEAHRPL
jgi:hypothetical protein